MDSPELVWYVSYGSNMHADRLACYVSGGAPPGGTRANPGCRDARSPRRSVPVRLPGQVYFALESRMWGGGLALYEPRAPGWAAARAYLVAAGQFADIAAQEMYRPVGGDLDLAPVLREGSDRLGPGRYETLVHAGDLDGVPLLTFTAPWRRTDVTAAAPSAAYLRMLGAGLMAGHGWHADEAAAYLAGRPGAAPCWDTGRIAALLRDPAGVR